MKLRVLGKPRIYLPLILLFIILLSIFPRTVKFNYDYKKGSTWNYKSLVAECNFPILKTPEQISKEESNITEKIVPYFQYSEKKAEEVLRKVDSLNMPEYAKLKSDLISELAFIYSKGVRSNLPLYEYDIPKGAEISNQVVYIQRRKKAEKAPLSEVFVLNDAYSRLSTGLGIKYPKIKVDSLLHVYSIKNILIPNLVFDREATNRMAEETKTAISPTIGYVREGQVIVTEGDVITAEIEQKLDSYKIEYEKSVGTGHYAFLHMIGNGILALSLVFALVLSIFYTSPEIFSHFNRFTYVLLIFLLAVVATLSVNKANHKLLYMVPFTVSALYLRAFFKKKVILPVYIASLIPLLIFAHSGVRLFFMFLISGMLAMLFFDRFYRGWKQFLTAMIVFLSSLITYVGFWLTGVASGDTTVVILYLFVGSLLSVAAYPLIYLFERIFMLVSNSRLMELCDTNNSLVRQLEHVAPGTFQHSLQVMNMADAAARSIGANVLLVRTGALYHDIGKTNNPICFIENESLLPENQRSHYHSGLTPLESASSIIRHVPDGLALADAHHLPNIIKDFIRTHHGTTCTAYFYNKFVNDGGDPSRKEEFCYTWGKPQTKEQIILMLCDALEAASRTMKDYSEESISEFVEKIVGGKMEEGQFEEADITIKELGIIKNAVKKYLKQLYHERVVYPEKKKPTSLLF